MIADFTVNSCRDDLLPALILLKKDKPNKATGDNMFDINRDTGTDTDFSLRNAMGYEIIICLKQMQAGFYDFSFFTG